MYSEKDLVRIAKRENNNKRKYLVVNQLQGKHIPVKPEEALKLFWELGNMVKEHYPEERLLLIGFAETATAIGAAIACQINSHYIQTTREVIDGVDYLFFSEEHSHATEQKLVKNDMDYVIDKVDRIVFIEDEVTTGNTIMNIIKLLKKSYQREIVFSIASLLNGMNETHQKLYKDNHIDTLYLVKTSHESYESVAEQAKGNGSYIVTDRKQCQDLYKERQCCGWQNARRLVKGNAYQSACQQLWEQVQEKIDFTQVSKVLVLGTEEFMYPALYTAYMIEQKGRAVRFHATTRSPIAVSMEEDYPLHTRYELASVYENDRTTFIYNLDQYDIVLIITDAKKGESNGVNSIVNGLCQNGNTDINYITWEDDITE